MGPLRDVAGEPLFPLFVRGSAGRISTRTRGGRASSHRAGWGCSRFRFLREQSSVDRNGRHGSEERAIAGRRRNFRILSEEPVARAVSRQDGDFSEPMRGPESALLRRHGDVRAGWLARASCVMRTWHIGTRRTCFSFCPGFALLHTFGSWALSQGRSSRRRALAFTTFHTSLRPTGRCGSINLPVAG
jgi:hypothetical protein